MSTINDEAEVDAGEFEKVERAYMPLVLSRVKKVAEKLATDEGREKIEYVDAFRAFEQELGGKTKSIHQPPSFFRENSFLIIIMTMTVIFGAMGLLPFAFSVDPGKVGYKPEVFLDIAKLFAGVIVGGAAGAAAATTANRRTKSSKE